ncbi:MAG: methyltransferase domain-containing protein [Pseudonocardiaceae bacterium]|nr:methyltransferase domain-containing protein [Pseudonocardiaceae bacterium]
MYRWTRVDGADAEQHGRWLEAVYSNTTLITALVDMALPAEHGGGVYSIAVSSSTVPSLMAQMLEDLDVHDGHRVLEIGTGTGYNAVLLSERLGEQNTFDLRPDLIDSARARLASAGYQPTLATADGAADLPEHGPFDRIIATCCIASVPPAWIEQLRPGGLLLVDIEGAMAGGNLAALHRRDAPVVEGPGSGSASPPAPPSSGSGSTAPTATSAGRSASPAGHERLAVTDAGCAMKAGPAADLTVRAGATSAGRAGTRMSSARAVV